jgi:hypothetical protein
MRLLAFTRAPCWSRRRQRSVCPRCPAMCRGPKDESAQRLASAPADNSSLTRSKRPLRQAYSSGVCGGAQGDKQERDT